MLLPQSLTFPADEYTGDLRPHSCHCELVQLNIHLHCLVFDSSPTELAAILVVHSGSIHAPPPPDLVICICHWSFSWHVGNSSVLLFGGGAAVSPPSRPLWPHRRHRAASWWRRWWPTSPRSKIRPCMKAGRSTFTRRPRRWWCSSTASAVQPGALLGQPGSPATPLSPRIILYLLCSLTVVAPTRLLITEQNLRSACLDLAWKV